MKGEGEKRVNAQREKQQTKAQDESRGCTIN